MSSISEKLESIRSKIDMIEEEKQNFYNFVDNWSEESYKSEKYHELKVRVRYAEKLCDARFSLQLEIAESNVRYIFQEDASKFKEEKEKLFVYLAKAYAIIDKIEKKN